MVAEGGKVVLWDMDPDWLEDARQDVGAAHDRLRRDRPGGGRARRARATRRSAGSTPAQFGGHHRRDRAGRGFPVDSWLEVMDVNLNGVFYCCRAVVPIMLAQGYGRIVNVASVAARKAIPTPRPIRRRRRAVIGFTKSLGKELATRRGDRQRDHPRAFDSPILQQVPQSQIDYMLSKIPMGRLGDVRETAAMVCFMLSEECSFTTASTFDTSGGRTTF
jgi:3-oxoacyl-[acyl-carrier protein] reductase